MVLLTRPTTWCVFSSTTIAPSATTFPAGNVHALIVLDCSSITTGTHHGGSNGKSFRDCSTNMSQDIVVALWLLGIVLLSLRFSYRHSSNSSLKLTKSFFRQVLTQGHYGKGGTGTVSMLKVRTGQASFFTYATIVSHYASDITPTDLKTHLRILVKAISTKGMVIGWFV